MQGSSKVDRHLLYKKIGQVDCLTSSKTKSLNPCFPEHVNYSGFLCIGKQFFKAQIEKYRDQEDEGNERILLASGS